MSLGKFTPTHTLLWNGDEIDVLVIPQAEFRVLADGGINQFHKPAFTEEDWRHASTASWTVNRRGHWFHDGRAVDPVVIKL